MPPCLEADGNGQRELIALDNHGVLRTCRFSAVSKHDTYANTSVDKSHLVDLSSTQKPKAQNFYIGLLALISKEDLTYQRSSAS